MIHDVIVRPIEERDLEGVFKLSLKAKDGLTTFPKNKKHLSLKIRKSIQSFQSIVKDPFNEFYFFVMEDLKKKKIIGVCSILSSVGVEEPFYSFEIHPLKKSSWCLQKEVSVDVLKLNRVQNGPSEVGTLFLDPDYRVKGLGRLLSLSRFMYIARFPHRFKSKIIAEMRGVSNEDGSPFWNHVIAPFFNMSFREADQLSSESKSFITELIPKYPIYLNLLHKEARDVIGNVHESTKPALSLLLSEGFSVTSAVDIFDAGPKLEISKESLRFAQDMRPFSCSQSSSITESDAPLMICGGGDEHHFTVCLGKALNSDVLISKKMRHYFGSQFYGAELYQKRNVETSERFIEKQSFLERFYSWYSNASSTLMVSG